MKKINRDTIKNVLKIILLNLVSFFLILFVADFLVFQIVCHKEKTQSKNFKNSFKVATFNYKKPDVFNTNFKEYFQKKDNFGFRDPTGLSKKGKIR